MGQALGLFLMFSAGFGFHQAFDWDIITVLFAMAAMVPGAGFVTDRLLRPTTRMRLENERSFQIGFLVVVSVLAFLVFQSGVMPHAETMIARFAATWWFVFPYGCTVLVLFDRVFDLFGSKAPAPLAARTADIPVQVFREQSPEVDNVIKFDPKRFH